MKAVSINVLPLGPEARWWAAEIVASLMSADGGVTSHGPCPHCRFPLHFLHAAGSWIVYECVRCAATHLAGDCWWDEGA